MNKPLSPAMSALWAKADSMKIGQLYREITRNADPAIRAQFKAEKDVEGTKAWGISRCMAIVSTDYTDQECEAISTALDA